MKLTSFRNRFAPICLALAMVAGSVSSGSAKDANYQEPAKYENIFLGEVAPTNYDEVRSDLGGVVGEVEVVRERYPDGKVRIERQVTLNGDGNYVNHGAWKLFTPQGDVAAEGQYNFGQRIGAWTRWIGYNDSAVLKDFPFKQFKAPFMSQATFNDGKMEGDWIITDANERKVLAVSLKGGLRNGLTTYYLPNGNIYRQMTYHDSVPVGDLLEVNQKTGELAKAGSFDNGRKIVTKTEHYPRNPKQLKSEIMYLAAPSVMQSADEFWGTTLASYKSEGEDLRNGTAKTWHPNGQLQQDGSYHNGKKTGTFTYWYENGQISTTGEYRDDKPEGNWVWYHENGQKSAVGRYQQGALVGDWRWWDDHGKLTKHQSYKGTDSLGTSKGEQVEVANRPGHGLRL